MWSLAQKNLYDWCWNLFRNIFSQPHTRRDSLTKSLLESFWNCFYICLVLTNISWRVSQKIFKPGSIDNYKKCSLFSSIYRLSYSHIEMVQLFTSTLSSHERASQDLSLCTYFMTTCVNGYNITALVPLQNDNIHTRKCFYDYISVTDRSVGSELNWKCWHVLSVNNIPMDTSASK